jgi:hypothetical protein
LDAWREGRGEGARCLMIVAASSLHTWNMVSLT